MPLILELLDVALPMHEPGGREDEEDDEVGSPCPRLDGSELLTLELANEPKLGFCFGFLLRV